MAFDQKKVLVTGFSVVNIKKPPYATVVSPKYEEDGFFVRLTPTGSSSARVNAGQYMHGTMYFR
jgi:hypothetical protein|tara:strand:+ start:71 stop:262 length:192 start_codon:yes stop_codon:yes gene_type:complete